VNCDDELPERMIIGLKEDGMKLMDMDYVIFLVLIG
jgi:hypothetical protein